jgi:hypothetical protein
MNTETLKSFSGQRYFDPGSFSNDTVDSVDYLDGFASTIFQKIKTLAARVNNSANSFSEINNFHVYPYGKLSEPLGAEDAYDAPFYAIYRLRIAPANWSTNPAEAPNDLQVNVAQNVLAMLALAGLPAPKIMLLDDGTLGAFWRRGDQYASIDFDVDGEYPWSAAKGLEVTSGIWRGGPLPGQILNVIGA